MYLILAVAFIIGCGAGTFCSGAAVSHNPEGVYKDLETGALNIQNLFSIFYSWFCIFFFPIAILGLMLLWSIKGVDDNPSKQSSDSSEDI